MTNIDVSKINPSKIDYDRVDGLRYQGKKFYGGGQPFRGQASKMAKLIKDPIKLIKRAKAVSYMYGVGDYFELPYGQYIDSEWKELHDVWKPFEIRLKEFGFSKKQINEIAAYNKPEISPKITDRMNKIKKIKKNI